MAIQPARKRWTYEEFARLPDDGNRYEVIAGELYMTPSPRPLHQEVLMKLSLVLRGFADQHGLGWVLQGPIDVLFAEGDYLEPDLVFVRRDRREIISDRGLEGPPDLVVEVLSPTTARRDRGIKRERYALYGVPEYWIVDAEAREIEVHRLGDPVPSPAALRDVLVWRPVPGGPELTISVPDALKGFA